MIREYKTIREISGPLMVVDHVQGAVSYTHLINKDTRRLGEIESERTKNEALRATLAPWLTVDAPLGGADSALSLLFGTVGAVSYTHLDVYKRQVPILRQGQHLRKQPLCFQGQASFA